MVGKGARRRSAGEACSAVDVTSTSTACPSNGIAGERGPGVEAGAKERGSSRGTAGLSTNVQQLAKVATQTHRNRGGFSRTFFRGVRAHRSAQPRGLRQVRRR